MKEKKKNKEKSCFNQSNHKIKWSIIGMIMIYLILSVSCISASENSTSGNNSTDPRSDNNLSSGNDIDTLTTYEHKSIGMNNLNVNSGVEILDNWAGSFIWLPNFIDKTLGKFHPPNIRSRHWYNFFGWLGDCIKYGLYCIGYAIGCIVMFLGWVVYGVGWLVITAVWSVYCLATLIVNLCLMSNNVDEIDGFLNEPFKFVDENITVQDPEKIMFNYKLDIFSNNNAKINNLNIPSINDLIDPTVDNDTNKSNSIIGNNSGDDDFNPDDPGILEYTIIKGGDHLVTKQNGTTPDRHNNINSSNYVYEDCKNNLNSNNLTNSNNLINCNNTQRSNNGNNSNRIMDSSNFSDLTNCFNLMNCFNLKNSVNDSNCRNSNNLTNCINVDNSNDSINCRDSSKLSNCLNCENTDNSTNSTNVKNLDNRHNEQRQENGWLKTITTENVPDVNGNLHTTSELYYTMSLSSLESFKSDVFDKVDKLSKTLAKTQKISSVTETIGGVLVGVSLIVSVACTLLSVPSEGAADAAAATEEASSNSANPVIKALKFLWKGVMRFRNFNLAEKIFVVGIPVLAGGAEAGAHIYFGTQVLDKEHDLAGEENGLDMIKNEIDFRTEYMIKVQDQF
jgi:hypothetical protein